MNYVKICFFLLVALMFGACEDNTEKHEELIQGHWEIVSAKRNNKHTEMLNRLYFKFSEDQTVTTNLIKSREPISYQVSRNSINLDSKELTTLRIVKCSMDELVLSTEIKDVDLDIKLKKSNNHGE